MASAIAFIQWESYAAGRDGRGFFAAEPLTFNSRQERLHEVSVGERLWLVSRHPTDGQYYCVSVLHVAEHQRNDARSEVAASYGEYSILADRDRSMDLNERFPA